MKLMRQVDVRGGFQLNVKLNRKTWNGRGPTCFRASGGGRDNTPAAAGVILVAVVAFAVTLRFSCSKKIQLHVASWEAGRKHKAFNPSRLYVWLWQQCRWKDFLALHWLRLFLFPIAIITIPVFAIPSSSCSSCCPSASAFSSPCSSWSSWWSSSPATPSTTSTYNAADFNQKPNHRSPLGIKQNSLFYLRLIRTKRNV